MFRRQILQLGKIARRLDAQREGLSLDRLPRIVTFQWLATIRGYDLLREMSFVASLPAETARAALEIFRLDSPASRKTRLDPATQMPS